MEVMLTKWAYKVVVLEKNCGQFAKIS